MAKKKKSAKTCHAEEVYKIKPTKLYSTYSLDKFTPEEVGTFSTNSHGKVVNCNKTQFPELISDIKFPLDLNEGLEDYYKEREVRSPDPVPLWKKFLRWICETNFDLDSVDLIARRGVLKYIGYTLYNYHRNPWSFKFCKYGGKLYVYEVENTASTETNSEQLRKYLYWGVKFERCVTTPSEDGIRCCYSMVRASVGKYRVLLGSEIDAARWKPSGSAQKDEPSEADKGKSEGKSEADKGKSETDKGKSETDKGKREYVELKTCFEKSVSKKLSFGWLQSYLAGVETLYFGLRDENGLVNATREYKVSEIPAHCPWNGGAMLGLISGVINWVSSKLEEGTSGTLLYRRESNDVVLTRGEGHFLPEWYVAHVDKDSSELGGNQERDMDWSMY